MQLFGGGDKFLTNIDLQNTSAGTNLLVGSKDWSTNVAIYGSTHALDTKYLNGKIMALTGTGTKNSLQIQNLSVGTQIAWSVWAKSTGTAILHTEVNGGAGKKNIQLGSDWTRVSSCGTPRGSGTLFFWNNTPNSEIDLCLPKIELGSIATQWCPAPEDYVMKSDQVLTTKNLIQALFSDELVNDVDDSFDMNNASAGIYRSWGKKPINAPDNAVAWAKYFVIPFIGGNSDAMFQIAIDVNGNMFTRAKGGSPATWIPWHRVNLG
jgi:hypothetical protein